MTKASGPSDEMAEEQEKYAAAWRNLRWRSRCGATIVFLAVALFIVLLFNQVIGFSEIVMASVGIIAMVMIYGGVAVVYTFPCPRCGHTFQGLYDRDGTKCQACYLPRGALRNVPPYRNPDTVFELRHPIWFGLLVYSPAIIVLVLGIAVTLATHNWPR